MKAVPFAGVLAVVIGLAAPAMATKIATREIACPIDGRKFEAPVMLSAYVTGRRLDLRRLGPGRTPLPLLLPVCPGSGFPVFKDEFDAAELGRIRRILRTAEYRKVRDAHPSYYVAAFLKRKLGYDRSEVAMDVLRAAWQAENAEKRDAFYLEEALQRFDELANVSSPSDRDWATARFLTVELSRRLGRFDEAGTRLAQFEAELGRNRVEFRPALIAQQRELIARGESAPQRQRADEDAGKE